MLENVNDNTQAKGLLYVISAPSGAGKTSLIAALLQDLKDISVSVSHTTRAMREGEKDGVHYHFVTNDRFQSMASAGEFLESAQVFDNHYGTSRKAVDDLLYQGMDVILEIDWQGAQQIRQQYPDCIKIFILPPSTHALRSRLTGRGQDDETVITRRMADAVNEMSHYNEYDFIVFNDVFEQAKLQLEAIVMAQRLTTQMQVFKSKRLLNELTKADLS